MRKSHGLLLMFSAMMGGLSAYDKNLHLEADRAGIRFNPLSGKAFAYGSPIFTPSWSQKVKAKRRAAQKNR